MHTMHWNYATSTLTLVLLSLSKDIQESINNSFSIYRIRPAIQPLLILHRIFSRDLERGPFFLTFFWLNRPKAGIPILHGYNAYNALDL